MTQVESPTLQGSNWKEFLLAVPLAREQGPRRRVAVAGAVMGGVLLLLTVLAAPTSRLIVPIGAPGSTLPDWILGVFAPIGDTPKALGRGAIAAGMDWGRLLVSIGFFALVWAWLAIVREAENISIKQLAWGIFGIYFLLLIAPPMFSTDIFTYLSAGRLQVLYGVNPYEHGPVVRPQDPVFGWTGLVWLDTPSVYGPLFTLLTAALTPLGPAGGMWSLKFVAFLSAGTCAWLTWKIAQDLGRPPKQALAFVALNPLLLLFALAGGHNDLLMLAVLLVAVRLTILARPRAAGRR
jgi:alpha-1,6-mannosyltransferase